MDVTSFRRDRTLVQEGQWVEDIPGLGNVRLKVRGLSSIAAVSLRNRKERAVPSVERERDGSINTEAALRLMREVLADSVLLDWDNLTANGEEVPYSLEQAREWMNDPKMMPFQDGVTWAAQVVDKGVAEQKEELTKN